MYTGAKGGEMGSGLVPPGEGGRTILIDLMKMCVTPFIQLRGRGGPAHVGQVVGPQVPVKE